MPYSTAADVQLLIDTSLVDTAIVQLIAKVDTEIDDKLAGEGLSVPSPTPSLITQASENLAIAKVLYRDSIADPTEGIRKQIEKFEKIGYATIKDYVRQSKEIPPIFSVIANETDME